MTPDPQGPFARSVGEEPPRLVDSYVIFIDALGSSDKMRSPDDAQTHFTAFRTAWAEARAHLESWSLAVSSFSDNVVAGLPIRRDGESAFGSIVMAAAWFQYSLATNGILVRGGMARDLAWIDEDLVFGPGLLRAVEIEHDEASYPRIVLSDKIEGDLERYQSYYAQAHGAPADLQIVYDEFGTPFVNYLRIAAETGDEGPEEILMAHREALVDGLFETRLSQRAQQKYDWAVLYHNHIVATYHPALERCLIPPRDPRYRFFTLQERLDAGL